MLFFSELIGKIVVNDHQQPLGKFIDLKFLNEDMARITKVIVEKNNELHEIAISLLKRSDGHVIVTKKNPVESSTNELSASKVLLDQQIIDLVGNKVVRVNDVIIQDIPTLSISGIDIGILGIFRRLGLEQPLQKIARNLRIDVSMQLLSWGDILSLELQYGQIKIKQREEKLARIPEEDLADYLEMTNTKNVEKFLKTLDIEKAAEVIQNLATNYQVELFLSFDPQKAAELIHHIDPDEAVDVLLAITRIQRDKIMQRLTPGKRAELHRLMTFTRTPIGNLMTSEYFAIESHETVRDMLHKIKKETVEFSTLPVVYVLNRDDQLVGTCSIHEALLQNVDTPAYKFMVPEPVVALLTTPIEVVINKLFKYKLTALPVINREKRILGIVTTDDVSELLLKKLQ